ncbi:MAG: hypothetical protein ACREIC_31635 [Limisphaerales bacterium]
MNTEIEIPIAQLKSVLPGLAKVTGRSSTLPVLQCIRVSLDRAGKEISLQAHSLDEVATVHLPNVATGLSGQMLVPLDMLTKIVKGCSADQSIRLLGTKQETKIRYPVAGSFVDRPVTHIPVQDWPEVKSIEHEPIDLDDAFKGALKEALECASEDSSRYVLNGACLDVRQKEAHYVLGTDGRHLYSANSFMFKLPEPLIIPTRKFVVWPGFINDGPWRLRMLPGIKVDPEDKKADKSKEAPPWLQIESDHWSYVAQAIDGNYPNWKQVVPADTAGWTEIVLQPSAVETILDALPLLPGNEDVNRSVTLVAGNGLALRAKGRAQSDWATIDVADVTVTGKAVEVALNRAYLLQALRFGLHRIQVRDLEPMIFSNGGKMMVVMLLRLDGAVAPTPAPMEAPSQTENAPAAPPSAPEAQTQTATTPVPTTATTTTPERGNTRASTGSNGQEENGASRSTFKAALEQIDRIKTSLRDVMGDLTDAVTMLKNAEKEQRASAKEIQTVRAKLREIQSVEI